MFVNTPVRADAEGRWASVGPNVYRRPVCVCMISGSSLHSKGRAMETAKPITHSSVPLERVTDPDMRLHRCYITPGGKTSCFPSYG